MSLLSVCMVQIDVECCPCAWMTKQVVCPAMRVLGCMRYMSASMEGKQGADLHMCRACASEPDEDDDLAE